MPNRDCAHRKRHAVLRRFGCALSPGLIEEAAGALVEVALVAPVLVLLLVGTAELGRLAYFSIEVSSAAYSGATFAARNHGNAIDTDDTLSAASQDALNVPGLSANLSTACYCSSGTSIACTTATSNCMPPDRIAEYVTVNTSASISPIFNYLGISSVWSLHGSSTMRVQQ